MQSSICTIGTKLHTIASSLVPDIVRLAWVAFDRGFSLREFLRRRERRRLPLRTQHGEKGLSRWAIFFLPREFFRYTTQRYLKCVSVFRRRSNRTIFWFLKYIVLTGNIRYEKSEMIGTKRFYFLPIHGEHREKTMDKKFSHFFTFLFQILYKMSRN